LQRKGQRKPEPAKLQAVTGCLSINTVKYQLLPEI